MAVAKAKAKQNKTAALTAKRSIADIYRDAKAKKK